jgi:hypothetical protein
MFSAEELHPRSDRLRHAQLLAALHNGPLMRKGGKKFWSTTEFLDDPWSKPAGKVKLTAAQLAAQAASINATRRSRRGH